MRKLFAFALAIAIPGCGSDSPSGPTVVVPTTTTSTTTTTTTTTLPPTSTTETFTGSLSAGDAPCPSMGIHDGKPCRRYPFVTSSSGAFEATLTWSDRRNDLDLELWRGGTRLINTLEVGTTEQMSSNLAAGSYEVRVVYYEGVTTQIYSLRIRRQN